MRLLHIMHKHVLGSKVRREHLMADVTLERWSNSRVCSHMQVDVVFQLEVFAADVAHERFRVAVQCHVFLERLLRDDRLVTELALETLREMNLVEMLVQPASRDEYLVANVTLVRFRVFMFHTLVRFHVHPFGERFITVFTMVRLRAVRENLVFLQLPVRVASEPTLRTQN